MTDFRTAPIDPTSASSLAKAGLLYDLVDTGDRAAFEAWIHADVRGFHGGALSAEQLAATVAGVAYRRTTGVWDGSALEASMPVATVSSWPAPLTVPGERSVEAWAISSVTVAPTHRRKGIARALLEGELRTASALGIPLAILTVSESTIYGRFGFAPGVFGTKVTIDTKRAKWTGPEVQGRVQFMSIEQFRAEIEPMHERIRLRSPGQIPAWPLRWDQISGLADGEPERSKAMRAVRFDNPDGSLAGLAAYRVTGGENDFTSHTLTVEFLASETQEAYLGLWRYLLEVDLVSTVTAELRSPEEPMLWQLSDRRAAKLETWDHLWLRILDVPAALQSRSWSVDGRWVFEVTDALGFAAGRFELLVADGAATVSVTDAPAQATLTVNALSALLPGGVAATTLAAAGHITEHAPGAVESLTTAFHGPRLPWLSVWF
jgi:predicted acetyltransferase